MFSKFLSLDREKQDRILNAAIKEFALKGYKNASTNEIVREAEISKGLLFIISRTRRSCFCFYMITA
jgi:AcrR family transcriptional regulator